MHNTDMVQGIRGTETFLPHNFLSYFEGLFEVIKGSIVVSASSVNDADIIEWSCDIYALLSEQSLPDFECLHMILKGLGISLG